MNEVIVSPQLTQIFREQLRNKDLTVTSSMTSDEVPGWDSTAMVGIIMAVEEEFNLEFTREELKGLYSVGDFARLIQRHKTDAAG